MINKALFLDRDGIINVDHGYVHKPEDFEFVEGIFELCRIALSKDYKIFVITNQAGIARGYYDIPTFELLSQWMTEQFTTHGIEITKVYYCPHHPTTGVNQFVKSCRCRKPEPGLILQAQKEFAIDLKASIFIGDKLSDMQAAKNAGVESRILVNSRYTDESTLDNVEGVVRVNRLAIAIDLID